MISKHFAVVGDPIGHSLSPAIHSAAYKFLGLDWDYTRFQVAKGNLQSFLQDEGSYLSGVSVTMPLKLEASALASSCDSIVTQLGVANTLVRSTGGFSAFNTDVFGIEMALKESWGPSGQRISILGAGATAQSALYAVSRKAAQAQVFIYVRDVSRTQAIQNLGIALGMNLEVREIESFSDDQDLTISTIPATALDSLAVIAQSGGLLNVNYSSKDSFFSKQFSENQVVQGETMLIWQAIAQIRIFLNGAPESEIKDEAALFEVMANAI